MAAMRIGEAATLNWPDQTMTKSGIKDNIESYGDAAELHGGSYNAIQEMIGSPYKSSWPTQPRRMEAISIRMTSDEYKNKDNNLQPKQYVRYCSYRYDRSIESWKRNWSWKGASFILKYPAMMTGQLPANFICPLLSR